MILAIDNERRGVGSIIGAFASIKDAEMVISHYVKENAIDNKMSERDVLNSIEVFETDERGVIEVYNVESSYQVSISMPD